MAFIILFPYLLEMQNLVYLILKKLAQFLTQLDKQILLNITIQYIII